MKDQNCQHLRRNSLNSFKYTKVIKIEIKIFQPPKTKMVGKDYKGKYRHFWLLMGMFITFIVVMV